MPIMYSQKAEFAIGKFSVLHESKKDDVVLAGSGITLIQSLKSSEKLAEKGINAAVIDIYCVKPFNEQAFRKFVSEHGNRLVIAEDHYPQGGIGEMLSGALTGTGAKVNCLAVKSIPHSATMQEELAIQKIDSDAITEAAKKLMKK
jgi:transketolase